MELSSVYLLAVSNGHEMSHDAQLGNDGDACYDCECDGDDDPSQTRKHCTVVDCRRVCCVVLPYDGYHDVCNGICEETRF